MKKIFSVLCAGILAVSLAACGSQPEAKTYTSEELAGILQNAVSENSEMGPMAEVITPDSVNAAVDFLNGTKGMSTEDAQAFMTEYEALDFEAREGFLTEKGFTAEEMEAFYGAEGTGRNAAMVFETLGLTAEDMQAGALSVSMINIKAYGIAIIQPAEGKGEAVKTALDNYVAQMQKSFESYLQDQYAVAKAAVCETLEDGTVIMVISENSDAIATAIKEGLAA